MRVNVETHIRYEADAVEEGCGIRGGAGVRLGDDAAGAVRW